MQTWYPFRFFSTSSPHYMDCDWPPAPNLLLPSVWKASLGFLSLNKCSRMLFQTCMEEWRANLDVYILLLCPILLFCCLPAPNWEFLWGSARKSFLSFAASYPCICSKLWLFYPSVFSTFRVLKVCQISGLLEESPLAYSIPRDSLYFISFCCSVVSTDKGKEHVCAQFATVAEK